MPIMSTSKLTLSTFLTQHRRRTKTSDHTHTWFGAKTTQTLSISSKDVAKLFQLLLHDAQATPNPSSDDPRCITEKVTRGKPFRFFADLDFQASRLGKWNPSERTLQQKLRDIVRLYQKVVSDATSVSDIEMIMTTRLPYKIHLHFPSVIVDTNGAKSIAAMFNRRFQDEHADIYEETVSDASVYTTGLRMLYCHKGSMAKPEKKEAEFREHQRLFPDVPFCDVYYVTDMSDWTQNTVPSIADLEATSIQAAEDAVLTALATGGNVKVKGKRQGKRPALLEAKGKGKVRNAENQGLAAASQVLLGFLSGVSSIAQDEIQDDKWDVRGTSLIIPTRSRACPIANREHNGNQQYFVVTRERAEQRCHDDQCTESVRYQFPSELVKAAVVDLFNAFNEGSSENEEVIELRREDDRLSAFRGIITEPLGTKTESAKLNLATADEKMTRMGYWTCTLPQNRYCPVCKSTHDRAENFMQISPLGNRGIGCNLRHGEFYPDPFGTVPAATINILFNNTINVNVTDNSVEIRDFGAFETFPAIHSNDKLDRLCHASLTGRTRSVAQYAFALMEGRYLYQDSIWYMYEDSSWNEGIQPDSIFTEIITGIYEQLRGHFQQVKQVKWLNQFIDELGNVTRRKAFIEDLERIVLKSRVRYPLDEKAHLLGFSNCVFDAKTGETRDIQADDYLSQLLPYALPLSPDPKIEQEIDQFFIDIMPNQSVRDFLWLMLALHLEGKNSQSVAMVWSGSGGNGKSVLTKLMHCAFRQLSDGQPATYLTTERPSPEKPSALMLS